MTGDSEIENPSDGRRQAVSQSDIVIHIHEDLDDARIHGLERDLSMRQGVMSACMHEQRRHLMVVDYDPGEIRSTDLLSQVRATGLHAELIGM
jgi:hypothetical protein